MKREIKTITRLELYKRVWETPITLLSKEYGLSDVGFAKICKKHKIPRPPRGYWARKAAGQEIDKIPLPNRSLNDTIEISANPANQMGSDLDSALSDQIESEKAFPPIVVAKTLRNPHPFVSESAEILELSESNDNGILIPRGKNCLDIRVSKNSLRRALRIIDALIKGLIERGFEVFKEKDSFKVKVHGEKMGFGISEDLVTVKTQPEETDMDGYYQFRHSRFNSKRVPSGKLCLSIKDFGYFWGDSLRKNWRDGNNKQLENLLDAFVIGMIKISAKKKDYEQRKAEEERQRQEIRRQREEEQRRIEELKRKIRKEKARVKKLITDAEDYSKSKMIREFIIALEAERSKGNFAFKPDDDHENWVKWALEQADRLDPLTKSPPSIIDELDDEDDEQTHKNRGSYPKYNPW